MNRKPYTVFNFVCFLLLLGVVGGIFWLWKDTFFPADLLKEEVPVSITFDEIKKSFLSPSSTLFVSDSDQVVSSSEKKVSPPSRLSATSTSTASPVPPIAHKEIPKEMNLAVPFTSQAPEKDWSQPWQDACEEAAVLMLDAYYKGYQLSVLFSKDEILKIVAWEEAKGWGRSIEIEKIKTLFNDYLRYKNSHSTKVQKNVALIENPTIEQLKQYVAAGTPVYVVVDGRILPNPHFQNGGPSFHVLIIRGYTQDSFITNDPGTQFGENFKYKYDDLMESIRDWNDGDVKHGRRVVLVME